MTNIDPDIETDDKNTAESVGSLAGGKFLIPTFQREFVREADNIIKGGLTFTKEISSEGDLTYCFH